MASFLVGLDTVSRIFQNLKKNPFLIIKPLSSFNQKDPIYFETFLLIVLTLFAYINSRRTNDVSWVDRLWSIAPIIYADAYALHYYYHNHASHPRLYLVAFLIFLWGVRLTYNFYIKGGYKIGKEDYRWETVRTWYTGKKLQWELFNLFFIHIYQMVSIWLFTVLPLYIVYTSSSKKIKLVDIGLAVLFLIFLLIETISDHQMFKFQKQKQDRIKNRTFSNIDEKFSTGFFSEKLYTYSRHPNYFGELGQWWTVYFFSVVTAGFNLTCIGIINLCFIFYKSIGLTEGLTEFKYPPYKYYRQRTSCLIPMPPGKPSTSKKYE